MRDASLELTVDGLVEQPCRLSTADLAALPAHHQVPDISLISPRRRGKAVALAAILQRVRPRPEADYLTLHAAADDFHASIPLAAVAERGLVIYEQDGAPLPVSAGGPFRFYIPDHAACQTAEVDECANVKFVDRIELTAGRGQDNRPADESAHARLHARQEPGH